VKILAIRGAGLASLSDAFEVSLDQGTLAHAGVFAIVGPTGAGKSTLLDALFLALFGDTPRLTNQQRVRLPGRRPDGEKAEPLTTRDARGLARGDVALAFAEVDFAGVDGERYRARWEVRRKRGGGAFKKPVHALSRLVADASDKPSSDGEVHRIGGTKTEVLGHVVARLGLDFDQFRRSVVLAQGEIAAFLHAPDRDRAELLERITGTEIYGEISREIHLETVRQRERTGLLLNQLASSSVMDASERRAAEQSVSSAHLNALQAEQARQTDETEVERHQLTLELARERDEATAEITALDAALADRAIEVRQVQSMRALGGLLPILRAVERAEAEVLSRRVACTASEQEATEATAREPSARSEHDAATQARTAADAELARVADALSEAERSLAAAQAIAARAKETLAHGAALSQQRSHAEAECSDAVAEQRSAEGAIAAWQAQRARWPALDDVLSRAFEPDDMLARAARIEREHAALDGTAALARGATLQAASERAERAVLDGRERLDAAFSRASRAERQLMEALLQIEGASYGRADPRSDVPGMSDHASAPRAYPRPLSSSPLMARQPGARAAAGLETIEAASAAEHAVVTGAPSLGLDPLVKRCADARSTALRTQRSLSAALAQQEQLALAHARRRSEQARVRIDRARFADELGRLQRELADATALAGDADRVLVSALRAGHAAELRAHLVDGDPCEVCGATEHPRISGDAAAAADTDTGGGSTALRQQRDEAHALREQLASRHFVLRSAFELMFAIEPAESDISGERTHAAEAARLRAQQSELDLALTALDDAEREARDAQSRVQREHAASAEAREGAARAKSEIRACEQDEHERSRKLSALAEEAASLGLAVLTACAEGAGQSTQAFVREAFASRAAAKHAEARLDLLTARQTRAAAQRTHLDAQIDAHREPAERAHEACTRAADCERAAQAARRLRDRRAQDLEHAEAARAAASVRLTAVVRAIENAEIDRRRAEAALGEATERASLVARDLDEQVTRALPHWAVLDQADATIDASMDVRETGDDTLRARLLDQARALSRCDPEALAERARAIEAMLKARDLAAAVAMERARRLQAHVSNGALSDVQVELFDRASICARLEALSIALEARRRSEVALRSELSRCEHLIERDDVARAARADKASAVSAAQEELAVWEDLLDALGSADGKKLRVHAQRLTLRALVREASLHLEAIAPRYAIEVVEGGDLAIQVSDRALGGEVRALGALSGGETFLVSLALALALRGLTSEQVRIASLFIDEGFGSLDAQSLDVVLSALDALEATGRQVGIVSHVPEVKERFAARIEVVPQGGGKSVVRVTA
jgi:exonuclease SbcC